MAAQRPSKSERDRSNLNSPGSSSSKGQRISGQVPAPPHQTLPTPITSEEIRRSINPPSHLDPPFAPRSPQLRPHYSDLTSNQGSSIGKGKWPNPIPPPRFGMPPVPGSALPPINPRNLSYQPNFAGTTYEPTSPVEAMSHEMPGRSSLFDDSTYNVNPFQGAVPQPLQSPTGSSHDSRTSSSGRQSSSFQAPQMTPNIAQTARVKDEDEDPDLIDRYILSVRQQPLAARACGFGERDRRVLDPPAVVQLSLRDFDPDSPTDVAELQYPFHIVHCSLFTVPPEAGETKPLSDVTSVPDPSKINAMCRRLMGTLVASPFVAVDPEAPSSKNENARLGCFFIFPDLSIRQTGKYRLRFTLMKVPMHNMIEGGQSKVAASVDSDIFEVYVAGHFPGMSPSSTLIKELKRQGAAVSLKKGATSRQKRTGDTSEKSGDEGSEAGETSSTKSRQKKKRS